MGAPRDAARTLQAFRSHVESREWLNYAFPANVNGMEAGTPNQAIRVPSGPGIEHMPIHPA